MSEHFDVIVVGAGLSGIGAAYHLQTLCPERSYAILEARDQSGGTWDLFRYPGIRSDSDMFTLGYGFKPWREPQAIADGASILRYLRETARENGIDQKIRFGHRVVRASWSSEQARYTVEVERAAGEPVRFTCGFLYMCPGYYAYDAGYTPNFAGSEDFAGRLVHPQAWPEDLDYAGRRVVVIGSGATAVTLVPQLAEKAAHVVMLQRSPSYVATMPVRDAIADVLRRLLPARLAHSLARWKNILLGMAFFAFARGFPELAKRRFLTGIRKELGAGNLADFEPRYNVWDQRVCLAAGGDLFAAIREGRASVVTSHVERFTRRGVRLQSGEELEVDVIVTATGLELRFLGGMELVVDGARVDPSTTLNYKGCMFSDVPNLAYAFGYTNASWTLKADLTADYVCRLLRHMDAAGAVQCTPRRRDPSVLERPWVDFSSGYVQRGLPRFPKQGNKRPWRLYQNYALDLLMLRHGAIDDGVLELGWPATTGSSPPRPASARCCPPSPRS